MTAWLLFATYISAVITLSFLVVYWIDTSEIIDVSCRCGRHTARDCVILDDSDLTQIRENLSDLCPVCRCNARPASDPSPERQRRAIPPSARSEPRAQATGHSAQRPIRAPSASDGHSAFRIQNGVL